MKTVLLLGGPAAGQRVEVHGTVRHVLNAPSNTMYHVVPMCSHGEVHWFGVLDGADPLALLIAGYASGNAQVEISAVREDLETAELLILELRKELARYKDAPITTDKSGRDIVWAPAPAPVGVGMRAPSPYGTGGVKEGDDR